MAYESNLQAQCVKWVRNDLKLPYGTFFSVPNEGIRSPKFASRLKAQGLIGGVPDLVLLTKGRAVFFELKAEKGRLSEKQKLVINNLEKEEFKVYIIKDLETFKKNVYFELNINKP